MCRGTLIASNVSDCKMRSFKKLKVLLHFMSIVTFIFVIYVTIWLIQLHFVYVNIPDRDQSNKKQDYPAISHNVKTGNIWKDNRPSNFCIGAVVVLRIYVGDKSELTTLEAEQWIRYLQYSGIQEFYLYDTFEDESEKLESWVQNVFEPSEVFYHDWHDFTPYSVEKTQLSAYQHSINKYKKSCEWHLAMDIDEYPFVLNDHEPGFLKRFVSDYSKGHPDCSELSFPNIIYSGYPGNNLWLIERYQRRFPTTINDLHKPLYTADKIYMTGLHHNVLSVGTSCDINGDLARMNHYWGARLQDWKPDTQKSLNKTIDDTSLLKVLNKLKKTPLKSKEFSVKATNRFWNLTST